VMSRSVVLNQSVLNSLAVFSPPVLLLKSASAQLAVLLLLAVFARESIESGPFTRA